MTGPTDLASHFAWPWPGAWAEEGACRGNGHALFLPPRGGDNRPAKAVCARCSVREECLAYALPLARLTGIWGGTSAEERERLRKERGVPVFRVVDREARGRVVA